MKHIVIDARLYGSTHTGIGRYVQNLLQQLSQLSDFTHYRWTLIVYPELISEISKNLGDKFTYITTNVRHYTFMEQVKLPFLLNQLHPDLVHVPHFNKPLLYFGKTVVTIHDLIKHFSKGKDTTTRHTFLYWPKYWAYLIVTQLVIKYNFLIVPTNYWRQYLINHFSVHPQNIITTPEAVDPSLLLQKHLPPTEFDNYVLYLGNLYPHKNIKVILNALLKSPDIRLKIVSKPNVFVTRTKKMVNQLRLADRVDFLGFVPDKNLSTLYRHALAFVFPSFMEGFGLPGLEAQSFGCPVIASNSSCLPEVYGDSVLYFDPHHSTELVSQINQLKEPNLRKSIISKGYLQIKKYSWHNTAALTLAYYQTLLSHA